MSLFNQSVHRPYVAIGDCLGRQAFGHLPALDWQVAARGSQERPKAPFQRQRGDMPRRSRDPRDLEVAKRVRALRLQRGISQTELGGVLDVTFQQVQKYETGTNRISAGRLQQIAEVLDVPVTYFYAGADEDGARPRSHPVESEFDRSEERRVGKEW